MTEYRFARGVRGLIIAALAGALALSLAAPVHATVLRETDVTYIPVTATIDTVALEFVAPDVPLDEPPTLILRFPAEMRTELLRSLDVKVDSDDVRPPAVSTSEQGVKLAFVERVPPGSVLRIEITGLTTPEAAGEYEAQVLWGETGAEKVVGGFPIDVDGPNPLQALFRTMDQTPVLKHFFSPTIIWGALPFLWNGFQVAVFILAVSYTMAIPLGLLLAFMKMSRVALLRWPANAFVDVLRGTPLIVQVLLIFFGITLVPGWSQLMGALGPLATWEWHDVDASQFYRAFIALSLNASAYLAEIFRAGIQSIHKGQLEAARSLGMSWPKSMTFVIIPQTVRRILPTMMSEFILLFKDTAILFAVGIFEITMQARTITAQTFNMSPIIAAAGFYLMLTVPLGRLVANFEERLSVAETGRAREPRKPGRIRRFLTSRIGGRAATGARNGVNGR